MADTFFQKVKITEIDLDAQFSVSIDYKYDLIFFLGILYHLQNPFYILEKLSYISNYMLLSTRVAKYYDIRLNEQSLTPEPINVVKFPVAYLLGHTESNNDPTNFWIFSESGLYRLLERTGWEILKSVTVGDLISSNQKDNNKDERAFCYLKSKRAQ
jgi:hypothetical protein